MEKSKIGFKVLVVDDSAFMRKVISDALNNHPDIHAVETAFNGQAALKKSENLILMWLLLI